MIPRILIIAGSDSGGGAGIQADIKTVTMLGGHAMTAITAITAQNTLGVQAVMPVPTGMVVAQIRSVIEDIGVDAVKIGMIGSADTANAVAEMLEQRDVPIVFDPVMVATSGDVLAGEATIAAFGRLMRVATVVTPNTRELAALSGCDVTTEYEQALAAQQLVDDHGCNAVLAKGGHLVSQGEIRGTTADGSGYVQDSASRVFDVLFEKGHFEKIWDSPRVDTRHTHGTGCTLASAVAAGLGQGLQLDEAVGRAVAFVRAALAHAPGLGAGHGPMGHALGVVPFDEIET